MKRESFQYYIDNHDNIAVIAQQKYDGYMFYMTNFARVGSRPKGEDIP